MFSFKETKRGGYFHKVPPRIWVYDILYKVTTKKTCKCKSWQESIYCLDGDSLKRLKYHDLEDHFFAEMRAAYYKSYWDLLKFETRPRDARTFILMMKHLLGAHNISFHSLKYNELDGGETKYKMATAIHVNVIGSLEIDPEPARPEPLPLDGFVIPALPPAPAPADDLTLESIPA